MNSEGSKFFNKDKLGLIHYYFGNGCGKTSIAIGKIVRALGRGLKVSMIQFLKKHTPLNEKGFSYGEYITLVEKLGIPVFQFGSGRFIISRDHIREEEYELASLAKEKMRELLLDSTNDLIVLDELAVTTELGIYDANDIVDLLSSKKPDIEVIITGRPYIREFADLADYVMEIKEIKHPYQQGVLAREGIEY